MEHKTVLHTVEGMTELEGGRFRKALIKIGSWANPADAKEKIVITKDRIQSWIQAAKDFHRPGVPVGHANASDPFQNRGFLDPDSLVMEGDTLYGELDIADDEVAKAFRDGVIQDGSIGIAIGPNPRTGETEEYLAHYAASNKPHVRGLDGYTEMPIAAESGVQTACFAFENSEVSGNCSPWGIQLHVAGETKKQGDDTMSEKMKAELEALKAKTVEFEAAKVEADKTIEAKDAKIAELKAKSVELEAKSAKGSEAVIDLSTKLEASDAKTVELAAKVQELAEVNTLRTIAALEARVDACAAAGRITKAQADEAKPEIIAAHKAGLMVGAGDEAVSVAERQIARFEAVDVKFETGQRGVTTSHPMKDRSYLSRQDFQNVKKAGATNPSKTITALENSGDLLVELEGGRYYWASGKSPIEG